MNGTDKMLDTRILLRDACDHIHAYHHSGGNMSGTGYPLERARDNIARALVPGAPHGEGEEWLIDEISTCITDSTDVDCTSESQARYIVGQLLKHLQHEPNGARP